MASHSGDTPLKTVLRDLTDSTPYARGAIDVLRLLGLVGVEEGDAAPTGEVAALLLVSLAAHLEDRVVVGFDWNALDSEGLRGVDILRAFEEARLRRVEQPTPGRAVRVVQLIAKARRAGQDAYLMQYDSQARQFQPIGGKWEPRDGDPAVALRREIAEELGLAAPPAPEDCALVRVLADWGTTALSATYGILTRYAFDLFHATAIGFPIREDADTRWITRAELAAAQADDGRAISTIYAEALGLDRLDGLSESVGTGTV